MRKSTYICTLIVILSTYLCTNVYAADTKTTALTELTAVNDADVLYIVDDPGGTPLSKKLTVLNLFDAVDTSAELLTVVTDETGTGVLCFATSPTFTTNITTPQVTFSDADASPDAVGELLYDNTVAGVLDGAFAWYDDDEVRYIVDVNATNLPGDAEDDYVLAYDKDADHFYFKQDADSGGATAWDDIGDPDNSGLTTITFDNAELSLLTGDNDAAASFITIQNTDADHTGGNLYLLDLDYSADDGDADADFIKCQDSGSVVFDPGRAGDRLDAEMRMRTPCSFRLPGSCASRIQCRTTRLVHDQPEKKSRHPIRHVSSFAHRAGRGAGASRQQVAGDSGSSPINARF